MYKLNLPSFIYKTINQKGRPYIFDRIRKKYVCLTPEEWVRQHVINYFIKHACYPAGLLSVECKAVLSAKCLYTQRADILVYNSQGKILMIVECKAPEIILNDKVIQQVMRYNTFYAPFIMFTNGYQHFCFALDKDHYQLLPDIPDFYQLTQKTTVCNEPLTNRLKS